LWLPLLWEATRGAPLPTAAFTALRELSGLPYEFVAGGIVRAPSHWPVANGSFVGEAQPIGNVQVLFSSIKLEGRQPPRSPQSPKKCSTARRRVWN